MEILKEHRLKCDGRQVTVQERKGITHYEPESILTYALLQAETAVPAELQGLRFNWERYSGGYDINSRKMASDYCYNINARIKKGRGLWIFSPETGSGKSLLAAAILAHAEKHVPGIKTMWTSCQDMGDHDKEMQDSSFWDRFLNADLVVVDEVEEPFGRYAAASPLRLRKRLDNDKAIIFSGSVLPENAFINSAKLISRIRSKAGVIRLPAEDLRQKGDSKENET